MKWLEKSFTEKSTETAKKHQLEATGTRGFLENLLGEIKSKNPTQERTKNPTQTASGKDKWITIPNNYQVYGLHKTLGMCLKRLKQRIPN